MSRFSSRAATSRGPTSCRHDRSAKPLLRSVLVTGASRGIGAATARAFLEAGWTVVATCRRPESLASSLGVVVLPLDVTDPTSVRAVVAEAEGRVGGALECVVNNAAYAMMAPQEDGDLDAVRAMFETNLFGALAITQAALPAMRRAGRGTIVNVSSVGAHLSTPLLGFYRASKAALDAASETLALECRPFGIRVALIEPGMVDTDFPKATVLSGGIGNGDAYGPLAGSLRQGFARWRAAHPTPAEAIAAAIVRAAEDPATPLRVPVGADAERLAGLGGWDDLLGFLEIEWR